MHIYNSWICFPTVTDESVGSKVRYITAKATVSTAEYDINKLGILTEHDYDKSALPKKTLNVLKKNIAIRRFESDRSVFTFII